MGELHDRLTSTNNQLEAANQELKSIAYIDDLTNLFNRRSLDNALDREWNRYLEFGEPLSLIMCDVDCFKRFNDTYGHPAGDRCLQQVGQVIRSSIRWPVDIGARYGGEEFTIVLTNTSLSTAVQVAERIRNEVMGLKIPHKTSQVKDSAFVTLSLGISCTEGKTYLSLADLIQQADRKLYEAKVLGRNQVAWKEDCYAGEVPVNQ